MANLMIIRDLCDARKMRINEVAARLEMSVDALQKMMKRGRTSFSTIEQLSDLFDVPVGIFFDGFPSPLFRQYVSGRASLSTLKEDKTPLPAEAEIAYLKRILEEKERLIRVLMNGADA